uniref:Alpha 1,4-glycosyltransferase domain-containing protein n=1 Tax=viral metagenome TaxID=1070528 RepID=A0A6C0GZB1_9ZZZZ
MNNKDKNKLIFLKKKNNDITLNTESNKEIEIKHNKTIFMTYYKDVPEFVFSRWIKLNNNYKINFFNDDDCIIFLKNNFNDYLSQLFKHIEVGMYKADLWRLCVLYIYGGVYADVDLVPHINIDLLDKNITFYSCLSIMQNSIFQAFIVNFSKPKNPLILCFLISFLLNKPQKISIGPTFDMYNCIKYNLNYINILPETRYNLTEIKIKVNIGSNDDNIKKINLYYFPIDLNYTIKLNENSKFKNSNFKFNIENNYLIVTKLDNPVGWDLHLSCDICIESNESIFLFPENSGESHDKCNVTINNKIILYSRDSQYFKNGGW